MLQHQQSITDRLINWGMCQRGRPGGGLMTARETRRASPYGGGGYQCMTEVVCNIMRMQAEGARGGKTMASRMDFDDAAKVQRAFQTVSMRHRLLLKDLYVLGKSVNTICRQLDIRHIPGSHWNRELKQAQDAIAAVVDPYVPKKKSVDG